MAFPPKVPLGCVKSLYDTDATCHSRLHGRLGSPAEVEVDSGAQPRTMPPQQGEPKGQGCPGATKKNTQSILNLKPKTWLSSGWL